MSTQLVDPFPTPSDLISTLQTFLFPGLPDGPESSPYAGLADKFEQRAQRSRTGWEWRSIQIDSRFIGPSTITGYHTRRSKIVRTRSEARPVPSAGSILDCLSPDLTRGAEKAEAVESPVGEGLEEMGTEGEQEEEDEAEARLPRTPSPVLGPTSIQLQEQTSTLLQAAQKVPANPAARGPGPVVIWVDWYIVYHATYRIPSLCFTAAWDDGTLLKLQDLLDYHILHPPSTSSSPSSNSGTTDQDQDHIPLTSDSPFPLILQEPHPCIKDLVVWVVHPCHVKPHISELLGDLKLKNGNEAETEKEAGLRMRTRWMGLWMGLHSRLLQDL